jgi:hypothetical protein
MPIIKNGSRQYRARTQSGLASLRAAFRAKNIIKTPTTRTINKLPTSQNPSASGTAANLKKANGERNRLAKDPKKSPVRLQQIELGFGSIITGAANAAKNASHSNG